MNAPTPVPIPPSPNRGSLLLGVGLAWAIFVGGYIVVALLIGAFVGSSGDAAFIVALLLPWIAMIALIVWLARRGQTRSAAGVAIGIASIFAVALLLFAACFGLLASSGWH